MREKLMTLPLRQLQLIARQNKIHYSGLKKDELIEKLRSSPKSFTYAEAVSLLGFSTIGKTTRVGPVAHVLCSEKTRQVRN